MYSLRAIGLVLLTLVLLPATAFVAYEVVSLGENERIMADIYDQQLETLLFSINQHAWDVSDAWADRLSRLHAASLGDTAALEASVRVFLGEHASVRAVVLADSVRRRVRRVERAGEPVQLPSLDVLAVEKLLAQRRAGYRRLEAVTAVERGAAPLLVFVPEAYAKGPVQLVGFALDAGAFVDDVLAPKLHEVARSSYQVALFRAGAEAPVYTTADSLVFRRTAADRTRPLWVFPDYTLGIRPVGASIGELVRQRFYRNVSLVLGLLLVLCLAAYALFRSVRRQVQLARMKSDFVSNVSHELRTPLALIRMYAETLEMGRVPEARRQEYLGVITQETDRLTHLVNNILNFSRMEAGRKPYASEPVDLNDVVAQVRRLYAPTIEQQGFTLTVRGDGELPLVRGDQEALTEAVLNLLDNAVKYSRDDRRIEIETGTDAAGIFVAVRDYGIGIAPEEQRHVFDQFYRVSTGLVHETRGAGLGLAIVDHIVKAHGGRVVLESRPGAGSRFTLHLPAVPAPVEAAASAHHPTSPSA